MSDRVAIIGGSTAGRDHFPFPVVELTTDDFGIGTVYPIGMGLGDACFAYFLVKTWRIIIDITADNDPPNPPTPLSATYYAGVGGRGNNGSYSREPYTRESRLVVSGLELGFETNIGTVNGDDSTTSNFAIFCNQEEFFGGPFNQMGWYDGLFYPMLIIDVDSPNGPSTFNEGSPGGSTAGTLSFMDRFLGLMSINPGYDGTIDIAPSEFWPYATKAGLPVYRTADGVQLRDPFS